MGKRIESGVICGVTASQWVALFFAFHRLPLPVILTFLLSVYLSHHRQGGGVSVGYGEETRSGCLCHHGPSSSPRPPSGSGGAMAALHLSSRRCRHSTRRRSPCHLLLRRGGCRSRRYVKTPLRHPTSSNSILTSQLLHCLPLRVLLALLLSVYFASNAGRRCWILRWGRETQWGRDQGVRMPRCSFEWGKSNLGRGHLLHCLPHEIGFGRYVCLFAALSNGGASQGGEGTFNSLSWSSQRRDAVFCVRLICMALMIILIIL
jgi:hypothetical protein